jgi:hypothetical protein
MTSTAHLWAVGYDNTKGTAEAREVICNLAWNTGHVAKYLVLEDIAVVVRHADGTFMVDREPLSAIANISSFTAEVSLRVRSWPHHSLERRLAQ